MRGPGLVCVALFTLIACGGDDTADPVDADMTPDADVSGTLSFSWTLTDGATPITCADVDATTVSITLLPIGVVGSDADAFGCAEGEATTRGFRARDYDVEIAVRTTEGDLTDRIVMNNVTIEENGNTDLGAVVFDVVRNGSFTFNLAAIATGGNCAAVVPDDGAEIVKWQLELQDGTTCVGVQFDIGASASDPTGFPADDYDTIACNDATYDGCILSDQDISVTDVESGPHNLVITGFRTGDVPCYQTTAQIGIPGGDLTTSVGNITIPVDADNVICVPE